MMGGWQRLGRDFLWCINGMYWNCIHDTSFDFIDETVMLWLSAAITAVGLIWAGHGLKDMSVKEVRRKYCNA